MAEEETKKAPTKGTLYKTVEEQNMKMSKCEEELALTLEENEKKDKELQILRKKNKELETLYDRLWESYKAASSL